MSKDQIITKSLGEVVDLFQGLAINAKTKNLLSQSGLSLWRIKDLIDGQPKQFIDSEKAPQKSKIYEDDVIVTRTGQVGLVFRGKKGVLHNNSFKVIPNEEILSKKFLYWFLRQSRIYNYLNQIASGSVQKDLKHDLFKSLRIDIPSLAEQNKIAEFFDVLEKKIELNKKTNETLEDIAKALFKSWFIDFDPVKAKAEGRSTGLPDEISDLFPDSFEENELGEIPKNWEITCLDQLTNFVIGGDWGKDKISNQFPSKVLCIRGADIPDLQDFGYANMPTRFIKLDSLNKRSLIDGDIIFEISGGSPTQSTGRPVLLEKKLFERFEIPLMCSNFCRIIRLKSTDLSYFIYYFLKHLYDKDEMFMYETGTTGIKNFGYNHFASSRKFTIPNQKLLSIYSKFIRSIRDSSNLRGTQSRTLRQIRDTLLPKLISGELSIPDSEKIIEDL